MIVITMKSQPDMSQNGKTSDEAFPIYKIDRGVSAAVTQLADGPGFPFNLRQANMDGLAYGVCCAEFGTERVDGICDRMNRSEMSYTAILQDLLGYDVVHARKKDLPPDVLATYNMARQSVIDDLSGVEVTPLSFDQVIALDDFPGGKSPGLPYKLEGYKTKRDVVDSPRLKEIKDMWTKIGHGVHQVLPDVCLFARAQVVEKPKIKIRATWGYPVGVYLEEARYFYPMLEALKAHKHKLPIAYGWEMALGGMSLVNEMVTRHKGGQYVCIDWSKFDKTIPPWLIRDAFSILYELIKPIARNNHHRNRWKKLVDYFVSTPIRTCKGERFRVEGGVPSGSCFTNIIDSIVNCIVVRVLYYMTRSGDVGSFPPEEIYFGDDSVIVGRGHINLDDMAYYGYLYFGMTMNRDKSYLTTRRENVYFLGFFNNFGLPYKPQDVLISSFIYPEHTRRTKMETCAAALGQLYSGLDSKYAAAWVRIIETLTVNANILFKEVTTYFNTYKHRFKYARMVLGVPYEEMTIPPVKSGHVVKVLPRPSRFVAPATRTYDYQGLWNRAKLL